LAASVTAGAGVAAVVAAAVGVAVGAAGAADWARTTPVLRAKTAVAITVLNEFMCIAPGGCKVGFDLGSAIAMLAAFNDASVSLVDPRQTRFKALQSES
jgi:hypothetical protein